LNPALLKSLAPGGYQLNVPKGSSGPLMAALQTVPPERRASWRMHRVESGETLATIGKRFGAAPSVIAAANRMEADAPEAGDLLVIPQSGVAQAPVRKPAPASRRAVAAKRPVARVSKTAKPGAVVKASGKRSSSAGRT
jgi:hypothetical protein